MYCIATMLGIFVLRRARNPLQIQFCVNNSEAQFRSSNVSRINYFFRLLVLLITILSVFIKKAAQSVERQGKLALLFRKKNIPRRGVH